MITITIAYDVLKQGLTCMDRIFDSLNNEPSLVDTSTLAAVVVRALVAGNAVNDVCACVCVRVCEYAIYG